MIFFFQNTQTLQEITSQTKIQNCVRGCNIALGEYEKQIERELRPLPLPELIRESKQYSSIILQWAGRILDSVTYLVHRKIVESGSDGGWQLHSSTKLQPNGNFLIKDLHPYVTYKFKIIAVVSKFHMLESNESVPITTLPHGVPASAPLISSLSAPSPTVITLSWRPPFYTNGPLLGYRINLNPKGHPDLKEVTKEVPGNATSWTLGQLQSSQLYIVTLSAWNAAGEGPSSQGSATTLNPGNLTVQETPYLILGADDKVCKQNIKNLVGMPKEIYATGSKNIKVTGVGIHTKRQEIIVSDSTGKVHIVPVGDDISNSRSNIYPSILRPTTISVDWLNDRAFIISRDRIYSCPLYAKTDVCVVVISGLKSSKADVKVDPLNGYMYYSDYGLGRGIYRVDLADVGKPGPIKQKQMVFYDRITSFAMDFSNMQLYYANSTKNTMIASYFDGSDVQDIRRDVSQGNFSNMLSMTYYDGKFYWSNGNDIIAEEYDKDHNTYRQNGLLFFNKHYSGLNVYHPTVQPTPVPFTAPRDIQALFNSNSAQISWKAPEKLQYQGNGAWNKWNYTVEIQASGNRSVITKQATNTSITISKLLSDIRYSIRVKAVSDTGTGPWSEVFIGRTLKKEIIPVKIYVAGQGEILEHDLRKHEVKNVIKTSTKITDLAWHNDMVMWTTSSGELYRYDRHTGQQSTIKEAHIASCLAYDWLGKKIFWSEPDKRVIRRSDIHGIINDSIYQTAARDMVIDSVAGRIYWATINTIESTYLNGEDHTQIFTIPFFSGKHVISLTINFDLQKVMWYVKSYENQDLYVADLVGLNGAESRLATTTVQKFGDFNNILRSSGLQYYSYHLFWLDKSESLVVGDQNGNYSSLISPVSQNITAFTVIHPSLQKYPDGLNSETTVVIPHPLAAEDISVVGHWSRFNVTWTPASEVNHGHVFYKVYIQIRDYAHHIITKETSFPREGISPYTQMTVTIQPYTYWGYADKITVPIRSPMSVPESPQTPRVYVTQVKNASTSQQSLAADFRWSTPGLINGILQHHYVYHWERDERDATVVRLPGTARHFILNPLKPNKTYFFKVEACTEAGCGPQSTAVSAKTDAVNPVPRLLIATKSAIRISEMDEHLNSTILLPSVSPSSMAFLAQEDRTFWIERTKSLFVAKESNQEPVSIVKMLIIFAAA
ncbi:hypothetical protein SNE40_019378 [Patella caerulea]|uniref:Fibronectin type-III domain-containing protein n=1 Tax=Patella caerulea TaxID=87958 RepID=A0AAN8J6E8_PATCE